MSFPNTIIFCFILFSSIYNIFGRDDEILNDQIKDNIYSDLEKIIYNYTDQIAITAVSLDKEKTPFYLNEKKAFVSASMIKLLILCEFIDQVDNKNISLINIYTYREEDYVEGSGVIQNMTFGTNFSYDTLALYMIEYSDNIATNVLIDILGKDNINNKSQELGLNETRLNRKMMYWDGTENYINAEDTEFILKGLLYNKIGSVEMCERAIEYLLSNKDFDSIMRGLPKDVKCAHKSGSLDLPVRHDGGIVYAENKYIIIILTKNFTNVTDANYLMGNISEIVYNILGKENHGPDYNKRIFIRVYLMLLIIYISLLI